VNPITQSDNIKSFALGWSSDRIKPESMIGMTRIPSKNASVVRKVFGYTHISQKWAPEINKFNRTYLNPYLNYHRPCFFPEVITNSKGKQQKIYPYKNVMTPYEKLKSLPKVEQYLKPEISLDILDEYALKMSDNEAANHLQKARQKLFCLIFKQDKTG
jgi:hypothetical protein